MKEKIKEKMVSVKTWAKQHKEEIMIFGISAIGAFIGTYIVYETGYTHGYLEKTKDVSNASFDLGYGIGHREGTTDAFNSLYSEAAENGGEYHDTFRHAKTGARMGIGVKVLPHKE